MQNGLHKFDASCILIIQCGAFFMADYSKGSAYVNGQLVPVSEAKISVLDWGFIHSDATYDVAHVWQGRAFRFEDHINRFTTNMDKLRMQIPYNARQIQDIMLQCVVATGFKDAYVEIICTRGMPQPGSRDPRSCTNNFMAFAVPFIWIADQEKQKEGLHMVISSQQRIAPQSVDPTIKNYHWLDMTMGLFEAFDRGAETAILVDQHGNLVEGPGFNIFAVHGNQITTPAQGVLQGITRQTAIEIALASGYKVNESVLSASSAYKADEIFITSTAGGIMPITKIDDQAVGAGTPGPVTAKLQAQYWELHTNPKYSFPIKY